MVEFSRIYSNLVGDPSGVERDAELNGLLSPALSERNPASHGVCGVEDVGITVHGRGIKNAQIWSDVLRFNQRVVLERWSFETLTFEFL